MSIDIDRGFVAAALAYASHDGSYAIETWTDAEVSTPLTLRFSPTFLQGPTATRSPRASSSCALAPLLRL